jgi:putative addiction module component (TIGR02574 family)
MPVLTKEQAFEAVMELPEPEREEVIERALAAHAAPLEPSEEHKQIIRDEIEAHRRDPSTAITRDELMAKMRAAL